MEASSEAPGSKHALFTVLEVCTESLCPVALSPSHVVVGEQPSGMLNGGHCQLLLIVVIHLRQWAQSTRSGWPHTRRCGVGFMLRCSSGVGFMLHCSSGVGFMLHCSSGVGFMLHCSSGVGFMLHCSSGVGFMPHCSSGVGFMLRCSSGVGFVLRGLILYCARSTTYRALTIMYCSLINTYGVTSV